MVRIPELGFTYIGILIAIALMGVGLAAVGELWSTGARREKERELLFIGDEFRRAITSYYDSSPGGARQFPRSFDDLLRDPRYPVVRRHLRKVYADPVTASRDWGIVPGPGGTIMGVYSRSEAVPVKRANFPPQYQFFELAERYADWRFIYSGGSAPASASPGTLGQGGPSAALQASASSNATERGSSDAVNPAVAAAARRQAPKERPEDPHEKTCGVLAENDADACVFAERRHGAAVGASCRGSAAARLSQCLAYGPLPILMIRP